MQKGLTLGFCVEEMGGVGGLEEMGLQGVQVGWGGRQRGKRSCQRTMWTLGGILALIF